jgi:lauroyl/myristoyl acyltransferase
MEELRRRSALLVADPCFRLAILAGRILPAGWLLKLGRLGADLTYLSFPGLRSNLHSNARRILGEGSTPGERARLAREVLRSFSRFILEWVAPKCLPRPAAMIDDVAGRERFRKAADSGSGVIAATIHMGNYELPGRELAALRLPVSILFERDPHRFLERIRSRARQAFDIEEIALGASRFAGIEALDRLREGGVVLLAGDHVSAPDAEPFDFLGGRASFSLWPARLARASGAPIVPAFCFRTAEGLYRIRLESPIFPADRSPREITAELVRVFESYVREFPEQWLMVHEFWEVDGLVSSPAG